MSFTLSRIIVPEDTDGASKAAESAPEAAGVTGPSEYTVSGITDWLSSLASVASEAVMDQLPSIGMALVILILGWIVIGWVQRIIRKMLSIRAVDSTIGKFLGSVAGIALKVMLLLSVAGLAGIPVTSFIAIISAATLAIGMSLKGTLSNFAGGVSVMLFRPYKVGDFVEGAGQSGTVKEIQIFNTVLTTGDNRTVVIPNNSIATGVLVNYSTQPTRRVEINIGIGYEDDIDAARAVVQGLIDADDRILKDPESMIVVGALGESSVDLKIRFWVNAADFWPTTFAMNESLKKAFDAQGINIPYPQQVVRHIQEAS